MLKSVASVIASEAEGLGINHMFAPVLDLSCELRWVESKKTLGRIQERWVMPTSLVFNLEEDEKKYKFDCYSSFGFDL
jgi:hypothetical protein